MRKAALVGLFVLLAGFAVGWAQNLDTNTAPKYLWIATDNIKPDGNHEAYGKIGKLFKEVMPADFRWIAEFPVAGNANQITYVSFLDSADKLEKMLAAGNKANTDLIKQDAALWNQANTAIASTQLWLAKFNPDLSINADKVDPPKSMRFHVEAVQVRPGSEAQLEDLIKEVRALHAKAGDDVKVMVFNIIAGEGTPGYFLVMPMATLADLDKPSSPEFKALMSPVMKKHFDDVVRDSIVKYSSTLFMVDPSLSRPPQSYIAANPDFWQVKEEPVVATTPAKKIKKEKPAALKEKQ